jgi:hypothetical protein
VADKAKKNKKFPKSVRTALKEGNLLPTSVIDAKHPKAVRKQVKAFVTEKAAKAAPRTGPYAYGDDPRFGGTAVTVLATGCLSALRASHGHTALLADPRTSSCIALRIVSREAL